MEWILSHYGLSKWLFILLVSLIIFSYLLYDLVLKRYILVTYKRIREGIVGDLKRPLLDIEESYKRLGESLDKGDIEDIKVSYKKFEDDLHTLIYNILNNSKDGKGF